MHLDRLKQQIRFVIEIDKLKRVVRQTILMDRSRLENDAEHSWHLAIMAMLLSEYAAENNIDLFRVIKMVLVHDLVEIDAGDTYCYDEEAIEDQMKREEEAADRIFNMLPEDQSKEIRLLWDEFNDRKTPEARFAAALDRLQPLLHNYNTDGMMWKKNGIKSNQVISRNKPIEEGAPTLWDYAAGLIGDAVRKGFLAQ
ncbi:MAG: HD domain-containing protein [Deltaproteobacteria bacterium]|nr:HD domain-containing protein [Deltaproteobacteria bacterium]